MLFEHLCAEEAAMITRTQRLRGIREGAYTILYTETTWRLLGVLVYRTRVER